MHAQCAICTMLTFPKTRQNSPNPAKTHNQQRCRRYMATLTRVKVAASHYFFVKSLLHFCKVLVHPNFDLETNYTFRKRTDRRFQRHIVCTEISSTFHTGVRHKNTHKTPLKPKGKEPKPPLPLRHVDPHLIHPFLDRPHSPIQTVSTSNEHCSTIHPLDRPTDRQTDRQMGLSTGQLQEPFTLDSERRG